MADYVPGTDEKDPKKVIMSLQQMARTIVANASTAATAATTTTAGIVELATDAETQALTDTARAVTPSNLGALNASTTQEGLVELATAAEMETGTDSSRVPSVSVVQNHPGVAKGWAFVDTDGVLLAGHNITSGKDSTGIYSLTLGTDMSSANYAAVATTQSGNSYAIIHTLAAGSFKVEVRVATLNTVTDSRFYVAAFGDQ